MFQLNPNTKTAQIALSTTMAFLSVSMANADSQLVTQPQLTSQANQRLVNAQYHQAARSIPSTEILAMSGGIDGAGGDGLELSSAPNDSDTVEVPVPSDLGRGSMLEVVGTPGTEQDDDVEISSCDRDSHGKPARNSCGMFEIYKLNTSISLLPGLYLVSYSYSTQFVEVSPDQKTTLSLKKIKIPKVDREVNYTVFMDFTDPAMRDQILLAFWSLNDGGYFYSYCSKGLATYRAACDAIASGNYLNLLNTVFKPDSNGGFTVFDFDLQKFRDNHERQTVTDSTQLKDGTFVSVLPGVYGIEFTDVLTGEVKTQLGIRVQ